MNIFQEIEKEIVCGARASTTRLASRGMKLWRASRRPRGRRTEPRVGGGSGDGVRGEGGAAGPDACVAPDERRGARLGATVLAGLLLLQLLLVFAAIERTGAGFGGDEPAYVAKASWLKENGGFPRLPPGEWGRPFPADFWGNSDWRPIGYPVFLAAVGGSGIEPATTRTRVAVVQFLCVAAALSLTYVAAAKGFRLHARACLLLGIGLGLQPWAFGYAMLVGPESLTMVLTWLGLVALAWAATGKGHATWIGTIAGTASLTVAGILRPESLVLAPLLVGIGVWLGRRGRRRTIGLVVAAITVFLSVVSLQVAYRWNLTGRLEVFGPVRFFNSGLFRWLHTWVNTEKSAYDGIAYRLPAGVVSIDELPVRAFRDRAERDAVARALDLVRSDGYTRDVDAAFSSIAEKRERESMLGAIVLPRLARTAQLWLNLDTNRQFLSALSRAPRLFSRAALALATLGRGLVLALFGAAVAVSFREGFPSGPRSLATPLVFLAAAYVLLRTLLVGPALGWMVARYMQPAWLPMLWCSIAGAVWVGRAWAGGRARCWPLREGSVPL